MFSRSTWCMIVALAMVPFVSAQAGGGPEGVLLVVNPKSPSSLTIANHYAQLRSIPPDNLIYVPWEPKRTTTDVDTFRRQILLPVLQTINNRRIANQIDYIVYSSDFPWGINLGNDIRRFVAKMSGPGGEKTSGTAAWPTFLTGVGSINGLTYLWEEVMAREQEYVGLRNNHYMRLLETDTIGFRGNRQFSPIGEVVASGGHRYFLSVMLGVTAGRGNSLTEVIDGLKRSAAADGAHPKGTIYFVRNSDVRSRVRDKVFPEAVSQLKKLGVAAVILQGTVPLGKDDVQGVVMGTASFNWKASGSTILPGAMCGNFTSLGGVMDDGAGQTPLSEFIRYGAAGASGTVVEPYAIAEKFPSPMIQVHYARGCTLAEAYYQSVHGPYQLLIVGDPLCRPWANVPKVSVHGLPSDGVVRGTLTLTPRAALAHDEAVEQFMLFVDGLRVAECRVGGTFSLNTEKLADGWHELRVVAVGPPPIESQGHCIVPVRLDNRKRTIEASVTTKSPLRADAPISLAVRSPGSTAIVVIQGSRVVGRLQGESGQIEIPANLLGAGPVTLRVAGVGQGGAIGTVLAKPLELTLE
ncbi:MAG: TIGR03790 family protein [Thermoguttaceae bacterium]